MINLKISNKNIINQKKTMLAVAFVLLMFYGLYLNNPTGANTKFNFTGAFKNPYFPVENGTYDYMLRFMPFGWRTGYNTSKLEYANPLPFRVVNEFNSTLNETDTGYATTLNSQAINTQGYKNLLDEQFNMEEYGLLDLSRQDPTKGRHARTEYSFVYSD